MQPHEVENMINTIHDLLIANRKANDEHRELLIHREIERFRSAPQYDNPKSLMRYGRKIYSQIDEDGIINEIFKRIGTTNKTFIEFGVGNGLANNTAALLLQGWSGLWIEASGNHVKSIKKNLCHIAERGSLHVVEAFITRGNINSLISAHIDMPDIDLLSVDIDGNDFHVLNAITCVTPRVMVLEYNAKFAPPVAYCMDYDESHTWQGDDCFGASLTFLEKNLPNYRLVGCNISGVNAFFVRKDLVGELFLEPFTAEFHYVPARYYLIPIASGHKAAYKTLNSAQPIGSPIS